MGLAAFLPGFRRSQEDGLRKAASQGDEQRVRRLLKAGASADPKKLHHTSALQLAAKSGCVDCVKALIEAGADVNRESDGSPLLAAAALGHVEVVKLLLEKKADPSVAVGGNTALHMSARFGHIAVLELLAAAVDLAKLVAAANDEGKTPLMLACMLQMGGEDVVAFLLDAAADPTATDQALNTALHMAATAGNLPLVKLLLAAGGTSTPNSKGRTPLHLAAVFGHQEIVELLTRRENVAVKDEEGSTALHMVCKSVMSDPGCQRNMARIVVGAGVDPTAKDKAGRTAADYADSEDLKKLLGSLSQGEAEQETGPGATAAAAAAVPTPGAAAAALGVSLAGSSSAINSEIGATVEPPADANGAAPASSKAEKMVQLAGMAGSAVQQGEADGGAGGGTNSWVAKQAMRRHTSEQQEWTLKTADDSAIAE